ncbi:hypothetical protein [Streptomyces malaysiensis]|uniref:Uncharacterized protein n=1 Tax=Streptomyces malaysiensis subsp. samsunensis TaxID=459658 RepID=A0A9X2M3Y7_STRMQ|nr:hypothetical protein [Streptomyces samsunensis]MCQ8834578.1 hypothetical protein [Streptomyces samsunensis]
MAESTVSRSVSAAGSAAGRSDSPGVALGPIALVLGLFSAVGAWVPAFVLVSLPWTVIAGGLAVALAAMVRYMRIGVLPFVRSVPIGPVEKRGFSHRVPAIGELVFPIAPVDRDS